MWKNVQNRLDNGESPNEVFDYIYDFEEGIALVKLDNKFNFINTEGKILSKQCFDDAKRSNNYGLTLVKLDNKFNFINFLSFSF